MRLTAALIACALVATAGAADIYTWRDKDGRVHYSDTPPANVPDAKPVGRSAAPAGTIPEAARRSQAERELEFRKRREAANESADKLAKEQTTAEEGRRNCEDARRSLTALESGQRITRYSSSGEIEYLDDAQRAEETARARRSVSDWCK